MTTYSSIFQIVNGELRGQDLSAAGNALQVNSLIVGLGTTSTLTQTILANLITLQNGTLNVATSLHAHDGIYTRTTALASTTGGSAGSTLIGDNASYSNFTPTAATVKGALSGIDSALAGVSGSSITSLTGDVTATGPGAAAATVAKIQGVSVGTPTGTGNVVFSASPTLTGTVTAAAISASGNISSSGGTVSGTNLTTAGHASADLALAGGTMSGNIAMGGNKVTGLGAPTANGDALRFDQLGANSGIATLDSGGKVPFTQLPSTLMIYKGAWDASTNTPTLADGTGTNGWVYRASVAGTQNLGSGSQTWAVGDFAIYNGTIWQHSPAADGVSSVNGATGAVTVNAINQLTGDVTTSAASGSQSEAATVAKIQGTTVSGTTGTGNVVFSAAPTLTGLLTGGSASFSSTIAASNFSGSSSGTNTGDQTITLTGDASGSGTGSITVTVNNAPLIKKTYVAGQSFSANTTYAVRFGLTSQSETAGRVYAADITTSTADFFLVVGVASSTGAVSAGGNITVVQLGDYTLASSDTSFGGTDPGKAVFLNASGAFSTTAPSTSGQAVVKVGIVTSTTSMYIQPAVVAVI